MTAEVDTVQVQNALNSWFESATVGKILTALITAAVSLLAIKVLLAAVDRALKRAKMEPPVKKLIRGVLRALLLLVALILVMGCLDIPATSLVAVLSVAGLALSLALQNFLSNVAGGLQIFASHPFKLGDWVEAGGCAGSVEEIGLFYTKLKSLDNKLIQLPNSAVASANIINYSSEELRQVELRVTASYDSDPELVRSTLSTLVGEHPLTLFSPEPLICTSAYKDSAIEYLVRVWCANRDYWTVYFGLLDGLKPAFDRAGIEMTYPHVNVHMVNTPPDSGRERA